jgi:hypothetical protein
MTVDSFIVPGDLCRLRFGKAWALRLDGPILLVLTLIPKLRPDDLWHKAEFLNCRTGRVEVYYYKVGSCSPDGYRAAEAFILTEQTTTGQGAIITWTGVLELLAAK